MPLICFASPSGGTGRTTLAANVARALSKAGARVIALDLDPQNALGAHFGLDLRDAYGFLATLRYAADPRAAWRAALRTSPSGVSFLPYGQLGMEGANTANAALIERHDMLSIALADMLAITGLTIVADLPAGASGALAACVPHADIVIAPLLPNPACVAQMPALEAGRFAGVGAPGGLAPGKLRLMLNQRGAPGSLSEMIATGVVQQLNGRLLGSVRYDGGVPEAAAAQKMLADFAPKAMATQDIEDLTKAIVGHINTATRAAEGTWATGRSEQLRNSYGLVTPAAPVSRFNVAQKVHP